MRNCLVVVAVVAALVSLARALRAEDVVVTSRDGLVEFRLPQGWAQAKPGRSTTLIRAESAEKGLFIAVTGDPKEDYDTTLERYAGKAKDAMVASLKNATATESVKGKVGNYPAIQCEVRGTDAATDQRLRVLHVVLETGTHYYILSAGAVPSRFDAGRAELDRAIQAFREVEKKK